MTLTSGLLALLVSALALFRLGFVDPKRRRTRGLPPVATPRTLWLVLATVPGVALLFAGQWAALTIWLGGFGVIGWGLTALLSGTAPAGR